MKWRDHVQNFGDAGTNLAITARVARLLLLAFVMTFLLARIVVCRRRCLCHEAT